MSDKKLVSDSTINYLVNRIKKDYIPFEDIVDLQEKVINPPTNTCESIEVNPDTNYEGFSTVTVNELNSEEVTVQSTAEQQVINNKYISKITVEPIIYEDKTVTLTQDSEEILPDTDEAMNSVTITPRIIVSQEKTAQTAAITKTITPDEGNTLISKLTVNPYNKLQDILAGNLIDITDEDFLRSIPAYMAPNIEHIDINDAGLSLGTYICEKGIPTSTGSVNPSGEIVEKMNYENLKSLNINGGSIWIGWYAFKDNQYLTTIPSKNGMYIICGNHAFENSAITSVPPIYTGNSYGENKLGNYAFYNCKDLEEIHFYGMLEGIGGHAFAGCTKLTSVYFPNAGDDGNRLPGSIGGYAFAGCTGLTSISFNYSAPGSTKIGGIGDYAFKDCTSLANVQLINAFSTGTGIFEGCTGLTSVTLPEDGYATFGANMFKGCTSLSSIISPIPPIRWYFAGSTVETSNKVFAGTAITELELAPLTVVDYSYINSSYVENPGILLGMDNLKKLTVHDIHSYHGAAIYIPYNVEHIIIDSRTKQDTSYDKYAGLKNFKNSDHSLNINTSLKKVEYINSTRGLDDFSDCVNLTDVTLCEGLTSTPSFYGCTSLTSIDLPSTVTTLGSFGKTGLTSISSENVTTIASFIDCTALTSVDLPNVTTIGDYAFQNCTSLTSINLPNITRFSSWSDNFEGYKKLTSVNLSKLQTTNYYMFEDCTSLTNVDLSSATTIEYSAFEGCTALTSIDLPNVTTLGARAFYNCTSLTNINLPSTITTIQGNAFYNCTNLTSIINLPNIATLGDYAFQNCHSLTSVTLSGTLTTISAAFSNCRNLTSVTLPDTLTELQGNTFTGCISLTSVTLPDSVVSVGWRDNVEWNYDFNGCTSLQTLSFGPNISKFARQSFYGCTALQTITVRGNSSCATAQTLRAMAPSQYNNATIVYTES